MRVRAQVLRNVLWLTGAAVLLWFFIPLVIGPAFGVLLRALGLMLLLLPGYWLVMGALRRTSWMQERHRRDSDVSA